MSKFSVKKPMTVVVCVILVLILGVVTFTKLTTDLLPSMDLPYAIVMTTYIGANPEAVESTVTKPVEQSMASISNIKSINSISNENYSIVIMEFSSDANMDSVTIDIRESLDLLEAAWTNDMIGTPMIIKLNPDMIPIMVASVTIDGMSNIEVTNKLNQGLLARIESVEGTAGVTAVGLVEEEIHVILSEERLAELNAKMQEAVLAQLDGMYAQLTDAQTQLTAGREQIEGQKTELAIQRDELTRQYELYGAMPALDEAAEQLEEGERILAEQEAVLAEQEAMLAEQFAAFESNKASALASADLSGVLTLDTISSLLTAQNFSMPAGYLTEEGVDYLVRVGDKLKNIEDLREMVLFETGMEGMEPVRLSDVAEIFTVDNSDESYAKVNGLDAVMLSIEKQNSYSTAEVTDALKARFEEIMEEDATIHFNYLMDQGMYIDIVVDSVLNNLVFGAILAILILFFFLKDIRPTAIIATSIPISVIFAIVLMYFSGITLNIISLSGLAVGVGMLVDNSIVVIENIYRLRSKGVSRFKAAVLGARQVSAAIVSSTLTTVCVFLPIVFVEGLTRQLFVDMALTVAYSLLASLIVALTLVPAMASRMLVSIKERKQPLMRPLTAGYQKLLTVCLNHRLLTLLVVLALLVGSAFAAVSRGTAFMPAMDSTQISVSLTMPEGATHEEEIAYSDTVMERILTIDAVDMVGAMSGGSIMSGMSSNSSTAISMYVMLKEDKSASSEKIAAEINELCADMPCTVDASGSSMDMSALGGSGITIQVRGDDLQTLRQTAAELAAIIADVEGVATVSDGMENPTPEFQIVVDKEKAVAKGLTVAQVYMAISGELSTTSSSAAITENAVEYPIFLYDTESMTAFSAADLRNYSIPVTGRDGTVTEVLLSEIAEITEGYGLSAIARTAQQRYLTVSAQLADGYNIGLVGNAVNDAIEDYTLPNGITITSSGENETINDAIFELVKMFLLAVAFIYLIMVAQFQSLLSPFIVMFTIPLSLTGGFAALFLTGQEVSVIAMIGFVMLAGIIVNNGIVLVDYVNQLRMDGMEKRAALLEAGKTRMRPIMMTALTTILGLSTMALGVGMGADMVQPIAIVTVGGLIYATFMTLFVVPVLYDLFHKKKMKRISEEELNSIEE